MSQLYDYAIVGAGVIGNALARKLGQEKRGSVIVLDKEPSMGLHASGRNSGVIHSGFNYLPGTLKSQFCIAGSRLLREYAKSRNVPHKVCGTYVVANTKNEERALYALFGQGVNAEVPDLQMLSTSETQSHLPAIKARTALFSPTGAIIDSKALVDRLAEDARKTGVTYCLSERVLHAEPGIIHTEKKEFRAKTIVNCAGLYADKIAHMFGVAQDLRIIPFRGEYHEIVDPSLSLGTMVYQAPLKPEYPFLGVHFTPTLDGKILAGPNSVLALGRESYKGKVNLAETWDMVKTRNFWKMVSSKSFIALAMSNAATSLSERAFSEEINGLLRKSIKPESLRPYRAGIRAQLVDEKGTMLDDLVVMPGPQSLHVLNAVSPGMTSSLAFADQLASRLP
jgi:L-2-hydroxyglutarate oxidase LhgO